MRPRKAPCHGSAEKGRKMQTHEDETEMYEVGAWISVPSWVAETDIDASGEG